MATKKEKKAIQEEKVLEKTNRVFGAWNMENKQKHILKFTHIPTGYSIAMPAFLDSLSDAYTSEWSEQTAYGRMDSMAFFGGTRRNISVAWNVPAESFEHAQSNLAKINALLNFLYPLYDVKKGGDPVMNMDPLLRLSFGNLIRNPVSGRGLLGYVNGITFDPVLEEGIFHGKPTQTRNGRQAPIGSSATAIRAESSRAEQRRNQSLGGNPQNNMYYPKTVRLNVEFRVLHEHSLGFAMATETDKNGKARASYTFTDARLNNANYPYSLPPSQQVKNFKVAGGALMASQQRGDPEAVSSVVQAEGHGLQPGDEDAARLTNLMRHTKAANRSRAAARYFEEKKPKGTPP